MPFHPQITLYDGNLDLMYNNDGSPTDRFEKLFMDSERRLKNKELNEKTS